MQAPVVCPPTYWFEHCQRYYCRQHEPLNGARAPRSCRRVMSSLWQRYTKRNAERCDDRWTMPERRPIARAGLLLMETGALRGKNACEFLENMPIDRCRWRRRAIAGGSHWRCPARDSRRWLRCSACALARLLQTLLSCCKGSTRNSGIDECATTRNALSLYQ